MTAPRELLVELDALIRLHRAEIVKALVAARGNAIGVWIPERFAPVAHLVRCFGLPCVCATVEVPSVAVRDRKPMPPTPPGWEPTLAECEAGADLSEPRVPASAGDLGRMFKYGRFGADHSCRWCGAEQGVTRFGGVLVCDGCDLTGEPS